MGAEETADNSIEVPIKDLTSIFKEDAWRNTQSKIISESSHKGTFYFDHFYDGNKKYPWFREWNMERYYVTLINRLRSNHYNLNVSLARKNYVESERCECGYEIEDIDHIVWRCHRFDEQRTRLGEILWRKRLDKVESIYDILKREDWKKFRIIYDYIKKVKRVI